MKRTSLLLLNIQVLQANLRGQMLVLKQRLSVHPKQMNTEMT